MAQDTLPEQDKLAKLPDTPVQTGGIVPTRWEYNNLLMQARAAKLQGLLPAALSAEQGFLIMLRGRELGIPPLAALTQLYIVDNKVAIMGKAKLAKVRESGRYGFRFEKVPDPKVEAIFTIWPYGHDDEAYTAHWTFADAEARGITKAQSGPKKNWNVWRDYMLRWRAASEGMDAVAPDVCMLPTVEELAEDFTLEGDKIVLPPQATPTIVPEVREMRVGEPTGYRMAPEVESAARARMVQLDYLPDDIEAHVAQVQSPEDEKELAALLKAEADDMLGAEDAETVPALTVTPKTPGRLIDAEDVSQ